MDLEPYLEGKYNVLFRFRVTGILTLTHIQSIQSIAKYIFLHALYFFKKAKSNQKSAEAEMYISRKL